jgi:hypothetical protein
MFTTSKHQVMIVFYRTPINVYFRYVQVVATDVCATRYSNISSLFMSLIVVCSAFTMNKLTSNSNSLLLLSALVRQCEWGLTIVALACRCTHVHSITR